MIKNRNNGPLFIAPRDEHGNKMIWNEDKQEYVVNEVLYAVPLKIAPRDSAGNKMQWNQNRLVYESKVTGQVFSTILMDFVEQKNNKEPECYMEDEALEDFDDVLYDEDEFMSLIQEEQDRYEEDALEAARILEEELYDEMEEERVKALENEEWRMRMEWMEEQEREQFEQSYQESQRNNMIGMFLSGEFN